MTDNPHQPREGDAVLGGQTPVPTSGAVLGGIEGIEKCLASAIVEARVTAISEAIKYGEPGWELVIQSLKDKSGQVRKVAERLLYRKRTDPKVKRVLREYNPSLFFECLFTLTGHLDNVHSVAISPDGQTLVSGSSDSTIKVWNLQTGREIDTLTNHSNKVHSVAIGPDGETLVSGSWDMTLKVWNLKKGREIAPLRTLRGMGRPFPFAIGPEKTIAIGSSENAIRIRDMKTGKVVQTLNQHNYLYSSPLRFFYPINSLAISLDGQTIVSGSSGRTVAVWDLPAERIIHTFTGHLDKVSSVAISPDGKNIVSGSWDKTIIVWDLQTGNGKRLNGHLDWVNSVVVSANGKSIISGSDDKLIKVWDLNTGRVMRTLTGHLDKVNSVAISSNGKTIVSGSADKTIKVWGMRS